MKSVIVFGAVVSGMFLLQEKGLHGTAPTAETRYVTVVFESTTLASPTAVWLYIPGDGFAFRTINESFYSPTAMKAGEPAVEFLAKQLESIDLALGAEVSRHEQLRNKFDAGEEDLSSLFFIFSLELKEHLVESGGYLHQLEHGTDSLTGSPAIFELWHLPVR